MTRDEIKERLYNIAKEKCDRGPGYSQEGVILRAARDSFPVQSLREEQQVLDCWHELLRDGQVLWGYNLDNPGYPFIRLPIPSGQNGT